MTDFERQLRDMLTRRADGLSRADIPVSKVIRRVRFRQAVAGAAAACVIGAGALFAPQLISNNPSGPLPPAKSPTASPSSFDIHPGEFEVGDNPKTEKRIEVAVGERNEVRWTLFIYKQDGLWCEGFAWDGVGGGCPVGAGKGDYVSLGRDSSSSNDTDVLTGELSKEVAFVDVILDGQAPVRVPVIQGPEQFGTDFFVAFIPAKSTAEVIVGDADGKVLQSSSIGTVGYLDIVDELGQSEEIVHNDESCIGVRPSIVGTSDADVLEGTSKADVILGLGGDDVITGLDGADVICGGEGNDRIDAGTGGDEVTGDAGDDTLIGGEGDTDEVSYWWAPAGVQVDLASGVAAGDGNDTVDGFEILGGTDFDDILIGSEGDDQIEAGPGDDEVTGLGGDDLFYGEDGDDAYDGGVGRDFLGFTFAKRPLEIDLTAGTAVGMGTDMISSIEIIHGGNSDDIITGVDADEVIVGNEGNDRIFGGGGDDVLWGDWLRMSGSQYRTGGMVMERSDDDLDGGPGNDEVNGGPGSNTCTGAESARDC